MNNATTNDEISIDNLVALFRPEARTIREALVAGGEQTFGELAEKVGDRAVTSYYLSRFEAMGLVVRGRYRITSPPENGIPGKVSQTFQLNYDVLQKCVNALEESTAFYRHLLEETCTV